jgi:enamine deaminase RidA (YjgF/YER057c/UK114 family)
MKLACALALVLLGATLPLAAEKKIIQPKEFAPGGPFNPGVLVDGTLYVSGQIGRDLNISRERVRQITTTALEKLKQHKAMLQACLEQ